MKDKISNNTIKVCALLFLLLFAVHGFEAAVLRTDETVFAENFINKLFGILILLVVLKILRWNWQDIGFSKTKIAKSIMMGVSLAAASFFVAFSAEAVFLKLLGKQIRFGFYTTGFSLTGSTVIQTGAGFVLLCVLFNVINVIMEEGTFRGLFFGLIRTSHSIMAAVLIQALFFGIWHIVTPLRSLIDGDMNPAAFIGLGIGYIVFAGMMGVKWNLLYLMTGNLYAGMADHFFNNCIATNLLHVSTETGIDEWRILRVLIAQTLSFVIVLAVWKKSGKAKQSPQ